jgi:hypothetical protein
VVTLAIELIDGPIKVAPHRSGLDFAVLPVLCGDLG